MNRDIPDHHAAVLRSCILSQEEQLPESVVDMYWQYKLVADRCGYGLTQGDLVKVAIDCGYGKPSIAEASDNIPALWRAKKVKPDHPVVVDWRGIKVEGRLLNVTKKQCRVLLTDDPEEKIVDVASVALA